jgi:hypothetical protein
MRWLKLFLLVNCEITTKVRSSKPVHGEVYSIKHYLIKFVSDMRQVGGLFRFLRGCTTSTKYWPPPTSWRLCQRLYYFYQILTTSNKMKIMSEVVLLLPNTDHLQQVEDYVRGCTTSTKYILWHNLHLVEGGQCLVEVVQPLT